MTEAGEKWVEDQAGKPGAPKGGASAEFWIRAFVDEVERRATRQLPNSQGLMVSVGVKAAFNELKRELLGEESK